MRNPLQPTLTQLLILLFSRIHWTSSRHPLGLRFRHPGNRGDVHSAQVGVPRPFPAGPNGRLFPRSETEGDDDDNVSERRPLRVTAKSSEGPATGEVSLQGCKAPMAKLLASDRREGLVVSSRLGASGK